MSPGDKKFLFDHIPKTGGTTFRVVLENIFGKENVSPWVSGRSERWAAKRYSECVVVSGHFHSPIPGIGTAKDRLRLTILREPIERILSEYYYYRTDVERVEWNKLSILAKDLEIAEYIDALAARRDAAVSNFYSRRFASQISRILWSEAKVLSLAKEALSRYAFVGIQEQFIDSVDVFCCRFDLPPLLDLPRHNVTSSRAGVHDLSRKTREKLTNMNRLDLELYDFAAARFQAEKRRIFSRAAAHAPVAALIADPEGTPDSPDDNEHDSFGDLTVQFLHATVAGRKSGQSVVKPGEEVVITLVVDTHEDVSDLTVGIEISDELGEIVFGTNTHLLGQSRAVRQGARYHIAFSFPANLKHGHYLVGAALHSGATHTDRCFHWCDRLTSFDIADDAASDFIGYCRLLPKIEWRQQAGAEVD